jgi:golgi phosphoprotein 3
MNIAQCFLLLALNDEKGTVPLASEGNLRFGVSAAVLAELLLMGRLMLVDKKMLSVADEASTQDEILDEALRAIAGSQKQRSLKDWVTRLDSSRGVKDLRRRLLEKLVAAGTLEEVEVRRLGLFNTTHYPALDSRSEHIMKEQVRAAVLEYSSVDERTVVLVSMLKACNLLDQVFTKEERKGGKRRIEELAKGSVAGAAASEVISEVYSAVQAATAAATASFS